MEIFKRADAAALAALYTEDTKLLPPGSSMLTDREAVKSFWQGAMDMGIKEAKLDTLEVESDGDLLAYETGKFALTVQPPDAAESATITGKYVVVWKNQDGNWKLHIDIWNADES